jgi:hypothetical protein
MTLRAFAVQSIPGNPLATVAWEVIGELWPALQTVLLRADAEVLRYEISMICHCAIGAECPATDLPGFVPFLQSFFKTSVMVSSS